MSLPTPAILYGLSFSTKDLCREIEKKRRSELNRIENELKLTPFTLRLNFEAITLLDQITKLNNEMRKLREELDKKDTLVKELTSVRVPPPGGL